MLWHFSCPFQYCGCETNWKASSNRKAWHHLSKPSSSLSSSGWHWSPLIPEAAQSSARRPASQRETRRMCRWLVFLLTFPGCRCVLPVVCHRPACRHHPGHLHDRTDCRCVTEQTDSCAPVLCRLWRSFENLHHCPGQRRLVSWVSRLTEAVYQHHVDLT